MTNADYPKDLVVLVADQNMASAVEGLLAREKSFGIRRVDSTIFVHRARDPGCLKEGDLFLRPFSRRYRHALLMFDKEGCGREGATRENLEADLESRLARSGWNDRSAAVVFDPELEVWVWSDSPYVERLLGWTGRSPDLRSWLSEKGYWTTGRPKPECPKEAVEEALASAGIPRSSSLYLELARRVGLGRCIDPAFAKFKATLQNWFPQEAS